MGSGVVTMCFQKAAPDQQSNGWLSHEENPCDRFKSVFLAKMPGYLPYDCFKYVLLACAVELEWESIVLLVAV
jgi:hypothetical protein